MLRLHVVFFRALMRSNLLRLTLIFSRCLLKSRESDEKAGFASARGSAILATLTEGISKLSGP